MEHLLQDCTIQQNERKTETPAKKDIWPTGGSAAHLSESLSERSTKKKKIVLCEKEYFLISNLH